MKKALIAVFVPVALLSVIGYYCFLWFVIMLPPAEKENHFSELPVIDKGDSTFTCGNSWSRKNMDGLYDVFTCGGPYERGVTIGKLTKKLIYKQEKAFLDQINNMVPSQPYLEFLNYVLSIYNRKLDSYIDTEYLQEINGISQSASDEFDYVGSKYQRMVNYHAAHDIGHMAQMYHLVGCTSFGAWGSKTPDSSLIIGRNFDFYAGDEFAKQKIVAFYKPDSGNCFMMITWAGMCGAVSGMNDKGLTITINAAKSYIPEQVGSPVSIVARHILQYASDIDEALLIAKSYRTFVSETFLIGSAKDNSAAIIEKTPYMTALLKPEKNDFIICTNHFQSKEFSWNDLNQKDLRESPSLYRYIRMQQLIKASGPIDATAAAKILRDQKGIDGKDIGVGNEKAVNQLIAHHSVIFEPGKQLVWVSTSPFQLGAYVCYDLNKVFASRLIPGKGSYMRPELMIPADSFVTNGGYHAFVHYKYLRDEMRSALRNKGSQLPDPAALIASNPQFYLVYELAGDYYKMLGNKDAAAAEYKKALQKEIPWTTDARTIENRLRDCR